MTRHVNKFFETGDIAELVKAHIKFSEENKSGFIQQLLDNRGQKETPKEFPEIEYEVKLAIKPVQMNKKTPEPTIVEYLDAFEFPPTTNARFLKDSTNTTIEGVNHFYGSNGEERLVVIEKAGKHYLKEKSQPLPLKTGVPYEEIVMKRTEKRWESTMQEILEKTQAALAGGAVYQGKIRKEKGDAFVLSSGDGRVYSFTITRAHCGDNIQRQVEIEYAGYVPGFPTFRKNDEAQIVQDMVDVAKHIALLAHNAPVGKGWKMQLGFTNERKYDFVEHKGNGRTLDDKVVVLDALPRLLALPAPRASSDRLSQP